MRILRLSVVFLFELAFALAGVALRARGGNLELRGWLSDEGCAGGRAKGGTFTGTNPDCAKECVTKGKKVVLVDPDNKRILVIANQDAAKQNIGDYVEVTGDLDEAGKLLHIDTLKMVEKGRAMCGIPPKKKAN